MEEPFALEEGVSEAWNLHNDQEGDVCRQFAVTRVLWSIGESQEAINDKTDGTNNGKDGQYLHAAFDFEAAAALDSWVRSRTRLSFVLYDNLCLDNRLLRRLLVLWLLLVLRLLLVLWLLVLLWLLTCQWLIGLLLTVRKLWICVWIAHIVCNN